MAERKVQGASCMANLSFTLTRSQRSLESYLLLNTQRREHGAGSVSSAHSESLLSQSGPPQLRTVFPHGAEGGTNQTLVSVHRPRPGAGNYPPRKRTQTEVPPSHLQTVARTSQSVAGTFAVSFPVRLVDLQGDSAARTVRTALPRGLIPGSHVTWLPA